MEALYLGVRVTPATMPRDMPHGNRQVKCPLLVILDKALGKRHACAPRQQWIVESLVINHRPAALLDETIKIHQTLALTAIQPTSPARYPGYSTASCSFFAGGRVNSSVMNIGNRAEQTYRVTIFVDFHGR